MNRIAQIHINNFKFFGVEKPIQLDGKHLLLYGENGSGKSTIYWSLYTLFEATFKNNDGELIKYFKMGPGEEESLVNIHAREIAAGNYDSFIEVTTDDNPPISFRLAVNEVAIRTSIVAKKVNYASDFIQSIPSCTTCRFDFLQFYCQLVFKRILCNTIWDIFSTLDNIGLFWLCLF